VRPQRYCRRLLHFAQSQPSTSSVVRKETTETCTSIFLNTLAETSFASREETDAGMPVACRHSSTLMARLESPDDDNEHSSVSPRGNRYRAAMLLVARRSCAGS
jgi:hypothetical protein